MPANTRLSIPTITAHFVADINTRQKHSRQNNHGVQTLKQAAYSGMFYLTLLILLLFNQPSLADTQRLPTTPQSVTQSTTEAQTQKYHVEVIVFEDADATYLHAEDWQDEPGFQQINQHDKTLQGQDDKTIQTNKTILATPLAAQAMPADKSAQVFKNTPPTILTSEAKRIRYSKHYNLLFYAAWTQAGLDAEHAVEIKLADLVNHAKLKTNNAITGYFKLVLARYLHFYVNLDYSHHEMAKIDHTVNNTETTQALITASTPSSTTTNNKDDSANQSPLQTIAVIKHYSIIAHRRMRSKILNYIDYPLAGILVQINPIKQAKPIKPEPEQSETSPIHTQAVTRPSMIPHQTP